MPCGNPNITTPLRNCFGGKAQKGDVIYFEPVSWRKKMQTAISDFSGEIIATITGSGIRHLSRRVVIRFHSLWQKSRSTIYL